MSAKLCKYTYFYIHDHLGSTSMVLDIDGNISQSVTYVPYGEVFVEERNGTWNSPYLFNSKELDEETGLYYYGARYLNPTNGVWLSVDPLWEKNIDASPYSYCHGNPVNKVDVMGLDDYGVDDNGYIFFIKKTDSEKDRLIAGVNRKKDGEIKGLKYDRNGELRNEKFEVSKGVLYEHSKENMSYGGHGNRLKSFEEAKTFFEFLANSTQVEWSFYDYTTHDGKSKLFMVGTSHNWDSEYSGTRKFHSLLNSNHESSFHIHSHPKDYNVSFDVNILPSESDLNFANEINKLSHKIRFSIYLKRREDEAYKSYP